MDPYRNVAFYDLETTTGLINEKAGRTADHIHVTEVAVCRYDDAYAAPWQALVRQPRDAGPLSADVVRITNITDELLEEEGQECKNVLKQFVDYVNGAGGAGEDVFLFSHNRSYDEAILRSAMRRCGLEVPSHWRFGCTLAMARLAPGAHGRFTLGVLIDKYALAQRRDGALAKVDGGPHRAGYDTLACLLLFAALREEAAAAGDDLPLDEWVHKRQHEGEWGSRQRYGPLRRGGGGGGGTRSRDALPTPSAKR